MIRIVRLLVGVPMLIVGSLVLWCGLTVTPRDFAEKTLADTIEEVGKKWATR